MSTRAVITFRDDLGSHSVYKHCDGYPNGPYGIITAVHKAMPFAWKLPRFEADDYAAAFVRSAKDGGGDVRLTHGPEFHSDLEFTYVVTCESGVLNIKVSTIDR